MNSIIVFTLKDLAMFVLWGLLIVVLVYIIKILIKAYQTIRSVQAIVEENQDNINATLDEVPDITRSINTISDEVAHDVAAFRGTVDNVAETSEAVTGTIKDNNDVVGKLSSIMHTASMGKNFYDKYFSVDDDSSSEKMGKNTDKTN